MLKSLFFLLPPICLFPASAQLRIFVTHGITYLPATDRVVVMKQGSVSEVGAYDELLRLEEEEEEEEEY